MDSKIHEPGYPSNEPSQATHSQYSLAAAAREALKVIAVNIIDCETRAAEVAYEKKQFYAEAKAKGFEPKALRMAIAFLKDEEDKTEQEQMRDLYVEALRERS